MPNKNAENTQKDLNKVREIILNTNISSQIDILCKIEVELEKKLKNFEDTQKNCSIKSN